MMRLNIPSALKVPSVSFTSVEMRSGFTMNPTKMQVKNATIGISTLLLVKSIISSMDIFIQLMNPRGAEPEGSRDPESQREGGYDNAGFLAAPVELIAEDRHDSLHQ